MIDSITYKKKVYPSKRVYVPGYGERNISIESLEDKLIGTGAYSDELARIIDETIFFYVPDEKISLPDNELGDYVYAMM